VAREIERERERARAGAGGRKSRQRDCTASLALGKLSPIMKEAVRLVVVLEVLGFGGEANFGG